MCVIDRDDTIECFVIKHHPKIMSRRLYVTCDLELYYENTERIQQDIVDVLNGINQVLNKNQNTHARDLQSLIKEYQNIKVHSDKVLKKKQNMISDMFKKNIDTKISSRNYALHCKCILLTV